MHQTTHDGLWTVTLTFAEWTAISVAYEKAMAASGLRAAKLEPVMALAESLIKETDKLAGVDDELQAGIHLGSVSRISIRIVEVASRGASR